MAKNNLSPSQLTSFLLTSVVTVALLNLAPMFFQAMGRGSWIGILIISVFTYLLLTLIYIVIKKAGFPTVTTVCQYLLGERLGKSVCLLFSVYLAVLSAITLRAFVYIINVYYLPHTPLIIVAAFIMLPSLYIALFGLRSLGHASQFIYLFIIVFFIIFLVAKRNYDICSVFPLFDTKPKLIVNNILPLCFTSAAILGSFYLFPQITNQKRIPRSILFFSLISGVMVLVIYFIGLSYFGSVLSELSFPFYHIDTVHKGRLLERVDIFYMAILLPLMGLFLSYWFSTLMEQQRQIFQNFSENHNILLTLIWAILTILLTVYPSVPKGIWDLYTAGNVANLIVAAIMVLSYIAYIIKRRCRAF
ncbi:MAG: GerAB/ArcD/ProY family transporter [Bacillota bacterium]|nr:GerAB/ArcD/ProY family transporter [Bacillota bacterium]